MDEHKHSPARIRYSNKVLYTMFRTTHRLRTDVLSFVGCQNSTNFKLASLGMRGAQERALLVLDDNNTSSTQQVQTGVQQHFSSNSMLYAKVQYSTSTDCCTPPTCLYMVCSYMESNSVLVTDGNTTSAVSPTRGGARPKYVWSAESPTKRLCLSRSVYVYFDSAA